VKDMKYSKALHFSNPQSFFSFLLGKFSVSFLAVIMETLHLKPDGKNL